MNNGWPELGTTDPARIEVMFGTDLGLENVGACMHIPVDPPTMPNLGILTGAPSGLVVLDVDPRNFGDETLYDLEKQHGPMPDTVQVVTGGGGWHHFFGLPQGMTFPTKKIGEGLDLKAHRGFVVGPGSRHVSGGAYEWEVSAHPDDVDLAAPPKWLMDLAGTRPSPYYRPRKLHRAATPEQQERFAGLWVKVALSIKPGREAMYVCPFHDDHDPSLHIDPVKAIWCCFGCGLGGGIRDLEAKLSQEVVIEENTTNYGDNTLNLPVPDPSSWRAPEPASGRCGGVRQLHQDRLQRERHRGLGLLCGEWECRICGPYLKEIWTSHLVNDFIRCGGSLGLVLCDPEEWGTVRKAIQRDPAGRTDFVHIDFAGTDAPFGDTTEVVITSAEGIGLRLDGRERFRLVRHIIQAIPFDRARVSTSESWERAKTKSPSTGRWRRVAPIRASLEESANAASELGLNPTPITALKGRDRKPWAEGYEFQMPEQMLAPTWGRFYRLPLLCEGADEDHEVKRSGTL